MSKYKSIIDWITENIDSGILRPGDKLPSEMELCGMFDTSRQTIRHALSQLTDEGLLKSIRGSGTYVSEQRSDDSNKNVIVVVTTYVDDYIFPSTIKGIERILVRKGYYMQVSFTDNTIVREREILQDILSKPKIAGVIMEPVKSALPNPNLDLYREIIDKGIKVLFINSFYPELDVPHVSMSDEGCAYKAVKQLINLGHQNIACVLKLDDGQGRERYRGYLRAITESGSSFSYDYVNWIDTVDIKNGKKALTRILERITKCTAVFCYNDRVAEMVIELLMERGISVPGDISVIGMDDSDIARRGVGGLKISSIAHPKEQLGEKAARNMIRILHKSKLEFNATYEFEGDVIIRDSVTECKNKQKI